MAKNHKAKRDLKEIHKLALKQVIAEDEELRELVLFQVEEVKIQAEVINELGNIAYKKRRGRPLKAHLHPSAYVMAQN